MVVTFALAVAVAALVSQQPETMSLLDEPLYAPAVPRAERARLEQEVAQARADVGRDPASAEAALRLARAQRALGHVGDALETLTRAIETNAGSPAVRLERGRGFIAIRKFELAQHEFRKAAETIPEAHCDLAFSFYLLADYTQAHHEYGACKEPGIFAYLAGKRAGENAGPRPEPTADPSPGRAPITLPGSVARSPRPESSMSGAYLDAIERLPDRKAAKALLKPIVEQHKQAWMEPIYVAAEADYAKIVKAEPKKKKRKR
jgi:tetratricopeptide (TPR) repeat protein